MAGVPLRRGRRPDAGSTRRSARFPVLAERPDDRGRRPLRRPAADAGAGHGAGPRARGADHRRAVARAGAGRSSSELLEIVRELKEQGHDDDHRRAVAQRGPRRSPTARSSWRRARSASTAPPPSWSSATTSPAPCSSADRRRDAASLAFDVPARRSSSAERCAASRIGVFAVGIILIYRSNRVINFALGELGCARRRAVRAAHRQLALELLSRARRSPSSPASCSAACSSSSSSGGSSRRPRSSCSWPRSAPPSSSSSSSSCCPTSATYDDVPDRVHEAVGGRRRDRPGRARRGARGRSRSLVARAGLVPEPHEVRHGGAGRGRQPRRRPPLRHQRQARCRSSCGRSPAASPRSRTILSAPLANANVAEHGQLGPGDAAAHPRRRRHRRHGVDADRARRPASCSASSRRSSSTTTRPTPACIDAAAASSSCSIAVLVVSPRNRSLGTRERFSFAPRVAARSPSRSQGVWLVRHHARDRRSVAPWRRRGRARWSSPRTSRQFLYSQVLLMALIALSLTVLTGWAGQLSLGQFALVGLGGVDHLRARCRTGLQFPARRRCSAPSSPPSPRSSSALPALRMRGLFLAVTTLALAVAAPWILVAPDLPRPTATRRRCMPPADHRQASPSRRSAPTTASASACSPSRSSWWPGSGAAASGGSLLAVRDNELAAAAMGLSPTRIEALRLRHLRCARRPRRRPARRAARSSSRPTASTPPIRSSVVADRRGRRPRVDHRCRARRALRRRPPGVLPRQPRGRAPHQRRRAAHPAPVLPGRARADPLQRPRRCVLGWRCAATAGAGRGPHATSPPRRLPPRPAPVRPGRPPALRPRAPATSRCGSARGSWSTTSTSSVGARRGRRAHRRERCGQVHADERRRRLRAQHRRRRAARRSDVRRTSPPHRRAALGPRPHLPGRRALRRPHRAGDGPGRGRVAGPGPARAASCSACRAPGESSGPSRPTPTRSSTSSGSAPYADRFVNELSTGMRRIVELACLVATDARMLCLDEPTAGVAQREAEAFGPLLLQVRRELDASHARDRARHAARHVDQRPHLLPRGRAGHQPRARPSEVRNDPLVIASYLGTDEQAIARSDAAPPVIVPS